MLQPNFDAPSLDAYDRILIAFSGGKDSTAALLYLLDLGVPLSKIELWHHEVDGREGSDLMDWPVTPAYCRALAQHFGIPIYFSWRRGGFEREMLRQQSPTAATHFETPDGKQTAGGRSTKQGTRLRFPQVSANLSVRWCSAYLKIDVMAIAIKNQPRFHQGKTLVVSGERAQESAARSRYPSFESHRTNTQHRSVDHWRPIHGWSEQQVWQVIQQRRINPHPAYRLGWGRLSCAACIFGSANQWASLHAIAPQKVKRIAEYEQQFGVTIHRSQSVHERVAAGTIYPTMHPDDVKTALSSTYHQPIVLPPGQWRLPAGAFGESAGPT